MATRADETIGADVPVRPAATVLLVRDGPDGPEVFLLERVAAMAFAAGQTVFPGGAVDPGDQDSGHPSVGPPAEFWARVLGCSSAEAAALVTAAMRELYEETGVLLTLDGDPGSIDPQNRRDLDSHRISWSEFLTAHGLTSDSGLLRPWSRWITPAGRSRRYDTYFFLALLPSAQEPDALTSEAVDGHWSTARAALARADAGEIELMRPTRGVLAEIAGFTSTAELFAATVGDRTADPQVPGNGERFLGPRWPVRTSELTTVVLAPNPGPMTLEGTNSYLIGRTGAPSVVVVDPGPQDQVHLRSLTAHGRVELILITHRHVDHTAGSAELHRLTGAPVRALDPEYCHGGPPLRDGERITAAGIDIEVIATPGHSSDSVCFRLPDDRSLRAATGTPGSGVVLTGDTILGRGTTVLAFPDGSLTDYFRSLNTLIGLGSALVLPAHGPTLPDLAAIASGYLTHRHERLDQVRAALAQESLPRTGAGGDPVADLVDAVTAVVYAAVPQNVQFAARKSVAAQIDHLIRTGELPDPGENPAAAPDPRRPGPMDVPRQTDPHAAEPTR